MNRFLAVSTLVLASGLANEAFAQDVSSWSTIMPSITHSDPLSMMLDDRINREKQRGAPVPRNRLAPLGIEQTSRVDMSALRYTPSKARRRANLANFVQKTRAVDPRGAADMQKVFAEGDFIEGIAGIVQPLGLHIDNVADAYACWWINAWQAAHGQYEQTEPALAATVSAQAARAISATGEMARASDAQKQELAEALWVQATLIEVAIEQAKGNPARLREIGDAVRKGAKGMGLNLDAIDLTSQGFVPVGVGQNDAPSTTPKPGSAAPYGALALAAGGMGVGGFLLLRQRRG
ncbi:DUF6683 family protein [Sphingomonas trueperi]|uniref:DUF6683 family protein n=1 Tax=Sphingomonas trueperi TaxID=53317 RepID=UPI000F27DE74